MRIAYLDCFAGISGDMLLGALIDAGVDPQVLHQATASLNLGATLQIEKVDRNGIISTQVQIHEKSTPSPDHIPPSKNHNDPPKNHHHETLIQLANISPEIKQKTILILEKISTTEAKIHNLTTATTLSQKIPAIVEIVAALTAIQTLKIDQWYSSPLNVGGGAIANIHGHLPIPTPVTADLLRDLPTYSDGISEERITPTGAALIQVLAPTFGPQPSMRVQQIGYGAGTHSVLRLSIGEATETHENKDIVIVLETALDDLNPQIIAHVAQQALEQGALDVLCTSTQMKKGRPGTLITILCEPEKAVLFEQLLFRETTTLGIRIRQEQRIILTRAFTTVTTPYGEIRIKTASHEGTPTNATPEFEDCRAAAAKHNVPVKQVIQSAITTHLTSKAK